MLRITEGLETISDGRTVRTLRLEGALRGQWVAELRRAWRDGTSNGDRVRVVLADLQFVDAGGKLLLVEMHHEGVEIVAHGILSEGVRDEVLFDPKCISGRDRTRNT